MPEMKRTRKGRPGRGAQRSALIVTRGKKSGRDATVEPKRGEVVVKARLESQLEDGDSVEAFLAKKQEEDAVLVTGQERKQRHEGLPYEALAIPRRPKWDATTTPEELRSLEDAAFTAWRRGVADAEEAERSRREALEEFLAPSATVATPFERNFEVWRQLWRTLERSHCVFLIVDARWPSFYANDDLLDYAASLDKPVVVVNNKADYLTAAQRRAWLRYWRRRPQVHRCVFFSAKIEQQRLDLQAKEQASLPPPPQSENADDDDVHDETVLQGDSPDDTDEDAGARLLRPSELLALGSQIAKEAIERHRRQTEDDEATERLATVGMIGYPNVGKSSCVNALRGATRHGVGARAGVSATPGKTKHLQTLRVAGMELCDCPGLVFPSLVANGAAELVCSGVVPLARARDPVGASDLVFRRVPAALFDAVYGTDLALTIAQGAVTAGDLLDAFCRRRDYKTAGSGQPDRARAARDIVKDYVDGTLLFCHPPPDVDDVNAFHTETRQMVLATSTKLQAKLTKAAKAGTSTGQSAAFLRAAQAAGLVTADDRGPDDDDLPDDDDDDDDVGQQPAAGVTSSRQQQPRHIPTKRANRWGKKGRRFRDANPYDRSQDDLDVVPIS